MRWILSKRARIIFTALCSVALIIVVIVAVSLQLQKSTQNPIPKEEVVAEQKIPGPVRDVIGVSVQGRKIESYTFGNGTTSLLFVGGIHGGYEWNSVLLAYQFLDYLTAHSEMIPKNIRVVVVPSANPDGVYKIIGKEGRFALADVPKGTDQSAGRFNAHSVDLNRNFGCKWQPQGTWRGATVSAGTKAFSEPEAVAIRDLVKKTNPAIAVFWHSQANAVYASECTAGVLPATKTAMNVYAKAAGYPAVASFDAYVVTGDAEGYLASVGIPAITVELSTHESIEWNKNLAGIQALLAHYSPKNNTQQE